MQIVLDFLLFAHFLMHFLSISQYGIKRLENNELLYALITLHMPKYHRAFFAFYFGAFSLNFRTRENHLILIIQQFCSAIFHRLNLEWHKEKLLHQSRGLQYVHALNKYFSMLSPEIANFEFLLLFLFRLLSLLETKILFSNKLHF